MLRRVFSNLLIRVLIALAFLANPVLPHAHGPSADLHAAAPEITDAAVFAEVDDHGHAHEAVTDGGGEDREQFGSSERHPHLVYEDHHHGHVLIVGAGTFLTGVKNVRFAAYQNHYPSNGPEGLLRPPRSLSSPYEEA